jgi:hypothetical protein
MIDPVPRQFGRRYDKGPDRCASFGETARWDDAVFARASAVAPVLPLRNMIASTTQYRGNGVGLLSSPTRPARLI